MNKKSLINFFIFISAITLLGHFGLSNICNKTIDSTENSQNTKQDFALDIQKNLTQEENALWDLITTQTGITKEECLYDREDYAQEEAEFNKKTNLEMLQNNPEELSLDTQNLIKEVLQDFNINPKSLDIIPIKTNFSPVGADDWTLYIDEEKLLSFPCDAQYFILGHELGHVKFRDISLRCALDRLIRQKGKDSKQILDLYKTFQEKRADMLALSHGGKYTTGAIAFFNYLKTQKGESFGPPSHPKVSDRLELAKTLALQSTTII